jgi:DNA-binding NtrC family response regulator
MSCQRVALVADDPRLGSAIAAHLRRHLGQPPLTCTFDGVHEHLGPDTDGLLLLAAGTPAGLDQAHGLIREVALLKLPPILVLIEAHGETDDSRFAALDPHVAHRLRWPTGAAALAELVGDRLERLRAFLPARPESALDLIRARLACMTPSLLPLAGHLALAAVHDVTVLLTGETGTGKTFLARLLHECSPRRGEPFVAVPCGALPPNLVESAFFGHVRGAFTGADRDRAGKFAAAGEGTLLLDEIDTLGLEQQASLLRVIETGEYEAVGSNETQLCRARIIVASNRDLDEAVARGSLRQDLYYRLNVLSFHLPPLRERVRDVAPLVRGTAGRFNTRFRKELLDVSPEALAVLESYPWPGNLRQLENIVQQAVLLSTGTELLVDHLPETVRVPATGNGHSHNGNGNGKMAPLQEAERLAIQRALAQHGYSRVRTADALHISRVTLYKKMRKYGLLDTPPRSRRAQ